jgi:NAD(P)-dependent dehydrogenase (short-subunit alcohol dehydrogenase family)
VELQRGMVAVVTGAASGIGLALSARFARDGLNVVLADVQADALERAAKIVGDLGVDVLPVRVDVSVAAEIEKLADATMERFGAVHVVCNNAGVVSKGDPWFGPITSWEWVMGVNFWGVVHGVRAFLPHLLTGGHIVNTASVAGLFPGFTAPYDASKHAVVAITEDLFVQLRLAELPIGVSVLCPGWVRTNIVDADRNWESERGPLPDPPPTMDVFVRHARRALDEGMPPAAVADRVAEAVSSGRFWVFPHPEFIDLAARRWHQVADGIDPEMPEDVPGLPPTDQLVAELKAAMAGVPEA